MIIDKLVRAEKYYGLNENFRKAFEYVKNADLKSLAPGKYEIDGEKSFLIIALDEPRKRPGDKLEAHRKYWDVQTVVEGEFGLKWKALDECENLIDAYDAEKDAEFYSEEADFEIALKENTFALLAPEDAHFPQPPKAKIKKAILKIAVK